MLKLCAEGSVLTHGSHPEVHNLFLSVTKTRMIQMLGALSVQVGWSYKILHVVMRQYLEKYESQSN